MPWDADAPFCLLWCVSEFAFCINACAAALMRAYESSRRRSLLFDSSRAPQSSPVADERADGRASERATATTTPASGGSASVPNDLASEARVRHRSVSVETRSRRTPLVVVLRFIYLQTSEFSCVGARTRMLFASYCAILEWRGNVSSSRSSQWRPAPSLFRLQQIIGSLIWACKCCLTILMIVTRGPADKIA